MNATDRSQPRRREGADSATNEKTIGEIFQALVSNKQADFALFLAPDRTILYQARRKANAELPPGWDSMLPPASKGGTWGTFSNSALKGCWFPILAEDRKPGLALLMRHRGVRFRLEDILDAWYFVQKFVSSQVKGYLHRRFQDIGATFEMLAEAGSEKLLLHAVCHYAVSPLCLGWERFWLFAQAKRRLGTFTCTAAHGHFSPLQAAGGKKTDENSQNDNHQRRQELRDALDRVSKNPLAITCAGTKRVRISLSPDILAMLYQRTSRQYMCVSNLVRVGNDLKEMRVALINAVQEKCREQGKEFEPDDILFCVPVWIGNRLHLAFFGQMEVPGMTEFQKLTDVVINRLARVIGQANYEDVDQDLIEETLARIDP